MKDHYNVKQIKAISRKYFMKNTNMPVVLIYIIFDYYDPENNKNKKDKQLCNHPKKNQICNYYKIVPTITCRNCGFNCSLRQFDIIKTSQKPKAYFQYNQYNSLFTLMSDTNKKKYTKLKHNRPPYQRWDFFGLSQLYSNKEYKKRKKKLDIQSYNKLKHHKYHKNHKKETRSRHYIKQPKQGY